MSKGPGRVERAITNAFTNNPSKTFSTGDLGPIAYPGVNRIEKKHRVAILRAADKVAQRLGWTSQRAENPAGEVIYYNLTDVRSYVLGKLRCDFLNNGRSVIELEERIDNPDVYGSQYEEAQPGGVWAQHVEIHKVELRGESADQLRRELFESVMSKRR